MDYIVTTKTPVLEDLDLSMCELKSEKSHRSLYGFMKRFKNLTKINLSHNKFGPLRRPPTKSEGTTRSFVKMDDDIVRELPVYQSVQEKEML